MKRTKAPYEKRRQTNSKSSQKTDFFNLNSRRIPVVSRSYIPDQDPSAKQELSTSSPTTDPICPVLHHEISKRASAEIQESDQNVSIVVENPFECLASFYFPEYEQLDGSSGDTKGEKIGPMIMGPKTKDIDIQEAEEEFCSQTENNVVVKHKTIELKQALHNVTNTSEIVNSVPELVKILQSKSQKKIILEERK